MATKLRRIGLTIAAIVLSASASAQAVAPELFTTPDSINSTSMTAMSGETSSLFTSRQTVRLNPAAIDNDGDRAVITIGEFRQMATHFSLDKWQDEAFNSGEVIRFRMEGASSLSTVTIRNGWAAGSFLDEEGRYFVLMPGRVGQAQELLEVDQAAAQRMWLVATNGGKDAVLPPPALLSFALKNATMTMSSIANGAIVADDVVLHKATMDMFYTAAVSDYFGGDAAAEVAMHNYAEEINTCFINGGYVDGRVWIRRIVRWGTETGDMETDLYNFATDPDVTTQRDLDDADVASWWVAGAGGAAFLGSGFRETAVHVVGVLSGVTNHTEAHEFGHNGGAQHNWEDASVFPPDWIHPYGYGYYNAVHADVMSYIGNRQLFYSNPGIFAGNGSEMGNADRDNMRVIRDRFPLISALYLDEPLGDCVPSATALCLITTTGVLEGAPRFQVEVGWTNFAGTTGQGQAVALTSDGGYFWFFNQDNPEVVIKMVDAVSFNGHFWVFVAGMTNVDVVVNITDTVTGAVWTGHNPLGTAFQPIQDAEAFAP